MSNENIFLSLLERSYGDYISHLVLYPRVCSDILDLNENNLCITDTIACDAANNAIRCFQITFT